MSDNRGTELIPWTGTKSTQSAGSSTAVSCLSGGKWRKVSMKNSSVEPKIALSESHATEKIKRKLRTVLYEFKPNALTIQINDTTARIMRIFKKYGQFDGDNVRHSLNNSLDISRSVPNVTPKNKKSTVPKKSNNAKPVNKKTQKQSAMRKELARLADSDGFVSSSPLRLKRQSKAVSRFDVTIEERKQSLRSHTSQNHATGNRQQTKVTKQRKTITKRNTHVQQVIQVKAMTVGNGSMAQMHNISHTSQTSTTCKCLQPY